MALLSVLGSGGARRVRTPWRMQYKKYTELYPPADVFLYSRYLSPNILSSIRSSPGIMKNSINIMKMTGDARETSAPCTTATPRRMDAIPRYIGLRLNRNGPEVTREVGSSDGCRVVAFFRNNERHQKARTRPKPMMRNPQYVAGGEREHHNREYEIQQYRQDEQDDKIILPVCHRSRL